MVDSTSSKFGVVELCLDHLPKRLDLDQKIADELVDLGHLHPDVREFHFP